MGKLFNAAWRGICTASVIFLLTSLAGASTAPGAEKFASCAGMVRNCIATLMIGVGFGVPSLIYETKLAFGVKVLIHMGVGVVVMLAASLFAGWMPLEKGLLPCIIIGAIQIAGAFIIWLIMLLKNIRLAKQINAKLEAKGAE